MPPLERRFSPLYQSLTKEGFPFVSYSPSHIMLAQVSPKKKNFLLTIQEDSDYLAIIDNLLIMPHSSRYDRHILMRQLG
jgi:hypothetical protein